MTIKQWLLSSSVAFTCLASTAAIAGSIENYSAVTAARLENPEPGNWMLYRRTYDGQGYSPLDQINASNAKDRCGPSRPASSRGTKLRRSSTTA
jgi:alcohol dehydrogenase (cytochrome c)